MKPLTIIYTSLPNGTILARAICEDVTLFSNRVFFSVNDLAELGKTARKSGYKPIFNCPDEWKVG